MQNWSTAFNWSTSPELGIEWSRCRSEGWPYYYSFQSGDILYRSTLYTCPVPAYSFVYPGGREPRLAARYPFIANVYVVVLPGHFWLSSNVREGYLPRYSYFSHLLLPGLFPLQITYLRNQLPAFDAWRFHKVQSWGPSPIFNLGIYSSDGL